VEIWLHSPTYLHSASFKHRDCIIFYQTSQHVVYNPVLVFARLIILTVINVVFSQSFQGHYGLIILKYVYTVSSHNLIWKLAILFLIQLYINSALVTVQNMVWAPQMKVI
jgi:hypothetical protein